MKIVPECRFVKPNGLRCQAPAMRDSLFCYAHARNRVAAPRRRRNKEALLDIPPLDGDAAAFAAINEVLQALASDCISPRRASSMLYCLQLARQGFASLAPGLESSGPDPLESLLAVFSKLPESAATSGQNTPRTPRQNAPAAAAPRPSCAPPAESAGTPSESGPRQTGRSAPIPPH